jgi:hypothetical protein
MSEERAYIIGSFRSLAIGEGGMINTVMAAKWGMPYSLAWLGLLELQDPGSGAFSTPG